MCDLEVLTGISLIVILLAFLLGYFWLKKDIATNIFLGWLGFQIMVEFSGKYFVKIGNDHYLTITYDTATIVYSILLSAFYYQILNNSISKKIVLCMGVFCAILVTFLVVTSTLSFMQTQAIVVFAVLALSLSILYIIDNAMINSKQSLFMRPSFWINMSMAVSSVMLIIRFGIAYLLFEQDLGFYTAIRYAHVYVQLFCNLLLIFAVVYPAYKNRSTTPFTIEL
jgi:hypothetical protein